MRAIYVKYIILLLFIVTNIYAENVNVTFEIINMKNQYLSLVQKKALELRIKKYNCYILKSSDSLSLRCNNSRTAKEMQKNIEKFNKDKIDFLIINNVKKNKKTKRRTLNEFYLGYIAFNQQNYERALVIFEYNYKNENNFEHAFAYSLALMKTKQYEKALKILKEYKTDKKASKLYKDIASTYMYEELNKKNYKNTHTIIDSFLYKNPKLHQETTLREIDNLISLKKYEDAKRLSSSHHLKNKTFDIEYIKALELLHKKQYEKSLKILQKYKTNSKINKLYKDVTSTYMYSKLDKKQYKEAHTIIDKYMNKSIKLHKIVHINEVDNQIHLKHYNKAKDLSIKYNLKKKIFDIDYLTSLELMKIKKYTEALNLLETHKNSYPKARELYNNIKYNIAIEKAWSLVETNPKEAIIYFKKSCSIKNNNDCYNGMMYGYYNAKMYKPALYLAGKLFKSTPDDKYAILAMRSTIKLKNLKNAKIWFNLINDKKGIENPYLLETFLTIDDHMRVKDYTEAMNIVNYIHNIYPNNITILKKKVELYISMKEYKNAKNLALKILSIDKSDIDAKYALSLYDFEQKNYENCVNELTKIELKKEYQIDLFNRCNAYLYSQKQNINQAINSIEKIDNNDLKASFYLDIATIYKEKNYPEAIKAYKKAIEYKSNDFGLELLYLYALKDFTKDDKLDKAINISYKKYPSKKIELDKFKRDYQKGRLFNYYSNHLNSRCYNYANYMEKEFNDIDTLRIGGWCAYSLKKYKDAKDKFAKVNRLYGETTPDIYAYALSCYQNGDYDRAIDSLKRIKLIDNEKDALLVSSLYIDLNEQSSAKEILFKLPQTKKRDELLVQINKSFTQDKYENAISLGMYYQSQSGINGKSRFDKFVVPLSYNYFNDEDKYHFYLNADLLYLYNGYLNSSADFGLNTTIKDNDLTSDIGFMPNIGLDYKYFKAEIGLTPLGAKITPKLTWLLKFNAAYKKVMFNIAFKQENIDESMLSFVGEQAIKDSIEYNWGRVLKRGFEVGISYSSDIVLSTNISYYPKIFGLNIIDNSEFKSTISAVYHQKVESISYVDIGALIAYDSFEKNSNLFTYGHGGYFSPQDFWLGSIYTKFGDIVGRNFYYQTQLSLGFEGYIVEDADKFPLSNDPSLIGTENGYRNGGLTYKGAIQLGYNITDNLDFISGFSMEKMYEYEVQQLSFAFVYRFNAKEYSTFNTFNLNHRVSQIIK